MGDGCQHARACIVLLNWNGWRDTLECLESVLRSDYPDFRVVVCDNASSDDSLAHIKSWADGRLNAALPRDQALPAPKPVGYREYDRATAEAGGNLCEADAKLTLIRTGANLGFAGGNNVGLRYALARGDFGYVWLLNNDTVVRADALSQLIVRMGQVPAAGMCGSTLLYYHTPDKVQAWGGGAYNGWLGTTRLLGALSPADAPVDAGRVESGLSFVSGASLLVSRSFLQQVGLMEEEYFLYFEEIDWAMRARGRYRLCYAPASVVYHKEGSSVGSNSVDPGAKSVVADYHAVRSHLVFTRRFYPWRLPFIYLGVVPVLINRVRRGQWQRVGTILSLVFGGWTRRDRGL